MSYDLRLDCADTVTRPYLPLRARTLSNCLALRAHSISARWSRTKVTLTC